MLVSEACNLKAYQQEPNPGLQTESAPLLPADMHKNSCQAAPSTQKSGCIACWDNGHQKWLPSASFCADQLAREVAAVWNMKHHTAEEWFFFKCSSRLGSAGIDGHFVGLQTMALLKKQRNYLLEGEMHLLSLFKIKGIKLCLNPSWNVSFMSRCSASYFHPCKL